MNYDLYELISIVLLIGLSVLSLYFVISEMMFNKAVQKQREILREHKLRNRLAKVDPLYSLKQLQNANWAQRNNKPTIVLARMNQADYNWRRQRDYNSPQLELFNYLTGGFSPHFLRRKHYESSILYLNEK